MATLRKRKDIGKKGIYEIQFLDEHQCRRTITLSGRKYSERTARLLQDAVETLIYEKINDVPIPHQWTKDWVEKAPHCYVASYFVIILF